MRGAYVAAKLADERKNLPAPNCNSQRVLTARPPWGERRSWVDTCQPQGPRTKHLAVARTRASAEKEWS